MRGTLAPDEAIARAYREYDYRMREIAGALGRHYATISRRLRAFERRSVPVQGLTPASSLTTLME